jgi:hypothetical protein
MTKKEEARASFSRLQNFLRIVPWLILLITLVVSGLTVYQSLQAKESLFRAWVTELSYKKRVEFNGFVEPVVTNLKIAREWGKEHGFKLKKTAEINRYFTPILKNIPQINALIIANSEGQSYYLRYQNNAWLSRSSDPAAWPDKILWHKWPVGQVATDGNFVSGDYDVRQRPWFKGALAAADAEKIYWTTPYRFSSDGQIGITAALRWSDHDLAAKVDSAPGTGVGKEDYVIAFDIKLCDLLNWLAELELGTDGQAFMISDAGRVLGSSKSDCRKLDGNLPALEFKIKEKFAPAFAKWENSSEKTEQIFTFRAAGMSWWAGFASLEIGDRHLWMVVVVPERDILHIADYPVTYFILPLLVFVIGIILFLLSFSFVRRHLCSLEALRSENHRLVEDELQREAALDDPGQRIYALIKAGESERLEFKSTVRWNLQKDKAGKEIEVAWLKGVVGFLNTEGGVLLIGVEDDGTIAGLERDNFTNDDKCLRHIDSLISTHIGLEFSRFIHFAIVEIGDKKIVEIRCQASEIPAFLKKGEAEEFFIRTGPASRKLKPSQIIKYLASHKPASDAGEEGESGNEN